MIVRIGTRNSPLAVWQAEQVATLLKDKNLTPKIIPIISQGDKNLTQPIYQMGVSGVWTKDLDIALLNNQIDIAVHSLKDIPTEIPEKLILSAVLKRDYPQDVLVRNPNSNKKEFNDLVIGSSSLRRQAFWKNKYPDTEFQNIRGNIQTRLKKMNELNYDGIILSLAGIERMNWEIEYEILDFLIPSPGQGVIACVSRSDDRNLNEILKSITDEKTKSCIDIERAILNQLEGGCSAPIGVYCKIENNHLILKSGIVSLDGKEKIEVNEIFNKNDSQIISKVITQILSQGGKRILKNLG